MKELYDNVVREATEMTGIDITKTKVRSHDIVVVRACVSNVMSRVYGMSLTGVSKLMKKHHTTILHHLQTHSHNQRYDESYYLIYERLSKSAVAKSPSFIDVDELTKSMKIAFS